MSYQKGMHHSIANDDYYWWGWHYCCSHFQHCQLRLYRICHSPKCHDRVGRIDHRASVQIDHQFPIFSCKPNTWSTLYGRFSFLHASLGRSCWMTDCTCHILCRIIWNKIMDTYNQFYHFSYMSWELLWLSSPIGKINPRVHAVVHPSFSNLFSWDMVDKK